MQRTQTQTLRIQAAIFKIDRKLAAWAGPPGINRTAVVSLQGDTTPAALLRPLHAHEEWRDDSGQLRRDKSAGKGVKFALIKRYAKMSATYPALVARAMLRHIVENPVIFGLNDELQIRHRCLTNECEMVRIICERQFFC
jgi:hypothetical protein